MADAPLAGAGHLQALPAPTPLRARLWEGFPSVLPPLIGRENEIAALTALVIRPESRLITVTGTGGVGKTRLAIAAAVECAGNFADGAVFVPLASVREPALVLSAIARSLDLRETSDRTPGATVAAALRDRWLLLVLDNFEHLVPAAAEIARLIAACPRLTVLVTSRTPLQQSIEQRVSAPPLALPPPSTKPAVETLAEYGAIALFVERARWVRYGFALTEKNADAILAICHRLDGLPLAIELAAAWVRVMTPEHLLERMDRRLPLLRGGPEDLPVRLRTMRDAIGWSYDLLTPDEARLFRHLAVFVGGFTLEAAEALSAASPPKAKASPPSILDLLARLIDKSLVQVQSDGPESRFQMLETVREYALERLADCDEVATVSSAHAAHMVNFALRAEPHLLGPEEEKWHARCTMELGNLRAALTWSLDHSIESALHIGGALWAYWAVHGLPEGRRWLTTVLSRSAGQPDVARMKALITEAALACLEGDSQRSVESATIAETITRAAGSPEDRALAIWIIGASHQILGDCAEAAHEFDKALTLFEHATTTTNRNWAAYARSVRGAMAFQLGESAQGLAFYEAALQRARAAGSKSILLLVLGDYAGWLVHLGETSRAIELLREALALALDVGGIWLVSAALMGLALVDAIEGNAGRAARRLGAVEAAIVSWGLLLPSHYQQRIDHAAALARASLGEGAFAAEWEAGRATLDEVIAEAIAHRDAAPAAEPASGPDLSGLSPRQREVLGLLVAGRSDRQIAKALFISHRTASHHVGSIMTKLGARTRGEAAVRAVRDGLI